MNISMESNNEDKGLDPTLDLNEYQEMNYKPKVKLGFLISISLVSAIGGFLFGYDTSVIAGASLFIENEFPGITDT